MIPKKAVNPKKEQNGENHGFFTKMRQSRGFTVVQGIAILGVCLGLLAITQTGYRSVVDTSVTNTGTFVTTTAP